MESALQEFEGKLTEHIINTDPAISIDKAGSGDAYKAFLSICSTQELAGRQAQVDDLANAYILAIHPVDLYEVVRKTLSCAEGIHFRKYDKDDIAERARAFNATWQPGSQLHAARVAKWEENRAARDKQQDEEKKEQDAQERKRQKEEPQTQAGAKKLTQQTPIEDIAENAETTKSTRGEDIAAVVSVFLGLLAGIIAAIVTWRLYPSWLETKSNVYHVSKFERLKMRFYRTGGAFLVFGFFVVAGTNALLQSLLKGW
jgi:hypothetical protein